MNIVLLQPHLSDEEIQKLLLEFPQYLFLSPSQANYKNFGAEDWGRVEILFGNRLSAEDLQKAHQLRWIHAPVPNINPLCLNEIEKRGNILVTSTPEENTIQIAEYVMGTVLAFAKNLFFWEAAKKNPLVAWNSKSRDTLWTLNERIFLQVGLGRVGTEIARAAKGFRMKVWGVQMHRSFHPHCRKVFAYDEIAELLPEADVVCISLPRGHQKDKWLGEQLIERVKEDSVLVVIGSKGIIDETALISVAERSGKFRGIALDSFYQMPVSPNSKLWTLPNTLITPEIAPRPKSSAREAIHLFRYNLRQYLRGNFSDMHNMLGTKNLFIT